VPCPEKDRDLWDAGQCPGVLGAVCCVLLWALARGFQRVRTLPEAPALAVMSRVSVSGMAVAVTAACAVYNCAACSSGLRSSGHHDTALRDRGCSHCPCAEGSLSLCRGDAAPLQLGWVQESDKHRCAALCGNCLRASSVPVTWGLQWPGESQVVTVQMTRAAFRGLLQWSCDY
jgi:hypothetical protein